MPTFLSNVLHAIADSFTPLRNALNDANSFSTFLSGFGWDLDPVVDDAQFEVIEHIFADEKVLLNALEDAETEELTVAITALIESLIKDWSPDATWPTPLNSPTFWTGTSTDAPFTREVLDTLLYEIMAERIPVAFGLLRFIGVFIEEEHPALPGQDDIPSRAAYTRRVIDWSRLAPAILNPGNIFERVYHWNNVGGKFEYTKLLGSIGALFGGFPVSVAVLPASTSAQELYFDLDPSSPASLDQLTILLLSYHTASGPSFGSMKLSFNVLPIPPEGTRTGEPIGVAIFPLLTGQAQNNVALSENVTVTLRGNYSTNTIFAEIRPDAFTFKLSEAVTGILNAETRVDAYASSIPWPLLGTPDSTRLELSQAHLSLIASGELADPEFLIEVGIDLATLVVEFSEGDGFLQNIFGSQTQRFNLSSAIRWSNKDGFAFGFDGQSKLEAIIPVHQTIAGVVSVRNINIGLGADSTTNTAALQVAFSGGVNLGPIAASFDRLGLQLEFKLAPKSNLGEMNLLLGFKSPTALGLAIDAGPITGGGFISFDDAKGRYSGILDLLLWEEIGVTAIGILDTKDSQGQPLPSPGYSFLIIISATLPNIQLGLGFTLNGIGGLLGIHRTIDTEALQSGIRSGSVDHIMFPEDPLQNMAQIISDLSTVFPPQTDRYVFGIMATLGWGTPSIVEVELGIIIQFAPFKLVLLGQLNMVLPSEDVDIVEIHIDVLGILDTEKEFLSIDASLHDSRVAAFSLSGDMAFRLSWGDPPFFLLTIGGYNPHFQPPSYFPTDLKRARISLGLGDNPRISLEAYLAISSNSIQFGAKAELYAAAFGFNIYGWLSFDALLIFSPFHFRFDFSVGFALRKGTKNILGIMLEGTLSGPKPFHIRGKACISILFFDLCISFSVTIGERQQMELPTEDPWRLLKPEIEEAKNWSASLPPSVHVAVSIKDSDNNTSRTLVHPMGVVTLQQKVLPFNQRLDKFGEYRITGSVNQYSIDRILIGNETYQKDFTLVQNYFARGQYQNLTDDQKLSLPSFEEMDSGISIGSTRVEHGNSDKTLKVTSIEYETQHILDSESEAVPIKNSPLLSQATLRAMSRRGAKALSPLTNSGSRKFASEISKKGPVFSVKDEDYIMVSTLDLQVLSELTGNRMLTKRNAFDALDNHLVLHPLDRGRLQIMSFDELEMMNE